MKRKKPEEPNGWSFKVDGGKQNVDGKPQWPDVVNLRIPRWQALEMIASLANQLQDENRFTVNYAFCGDLKESE